MNYDSSNQSHAILISSILLWSVLSNVTTFGVSFAEDGNEDSPYDSGNNEDNSTGQDENRGTDADYDDYDGEEYDEFYYESDPFQPAMEESILDDMVTIDEQDIVTVNVLVNDRSVLGWDKSLAIHYVSKPLFGDVTVNHDNTITYNPFQIALPAGYEKLDSFYYTVRAGINTYYNGTISIWTRQTNDAPVASSAEYMLNENGEITFSLYAYDEDNDILTFTILSNTTFGESVLDPRTGTVVYTPHYKFSGHDSLTYQVSDGFSASSIESVRFDVLKVGGHGSAQDDQQPIDQSDADEQPVDGDNDGGSSNSTAGNSMPIADAGESIMVIEGITVTLDGSNSYDPDDDEITYSWSQEAGPFASLDNSGLVSPSFTAPDVESAAIITFRLVVTDGNLTSSSSSVSITVISLDVDVMPNEYPNNIKLSEPDAEIPVAILSDSHLDASVSIDGDSLTFGPASAEALSYAIVDIDQDGSEDLVSYYRSGDLGLKKGDKKACLTGSVALNNNDDFQFNVCRNVKVLD
ncbi:MAG: Ig-like domain-containing protein [Nitrososphaera sp.]